MDELKGILGGKVAGIPRWGWFALLSTALIAALYIKHRRMMAADVGDPGVDESSSADPNLQSTIEGSGDPSLAGYGGTVGAAGAGTTPVESPVIPAGYPELLTGLGGVLGGAVKAQTDIVGGQTVHGPPGGGVKIVDPRRDPRKGPKPVITVPTGGGPPKKPPPKHSPVQPPPNPKGTPHPVIIEPSRPTAGRHPAPSTPPLRRPVPSTALRPTKGKPKKGSAGKAVASPRRIPVLNPKPPKKSRGV